MMLRMPFFRKCTLVIACYLSFILPAYAVYTLTWPSETSSVSSPMGYRIPPTTTNGGQGSGLHNGIDIPAPYGSPIFAPFAGTVSTSYNSSCGNTLYVKSTPGGAMVAGFCHLSSYEVRSGAVNAGGVVGYVGDTGNVTGPHIHYTLKLMAPSGAMQRVDPASAQGQDLSDPEVVARLIEEGQRIMSGGATGATSISGSLTGTGTGTYGSGYNIGPSTGGASSGDQSCSSEILSTGQQLSEANMNLEMQQINEAISPPANVAQMSCIDQFGELFNSKIGNIFGDGLEIFNFGGIFEDTQNAINSQIDAAINNNLLGGRGANVTSSISTAITDAFNNLLGNPESGSFTCEAMNILWEIMQCEGILDFEIPSRQELLEGGISSGLGDMLEGLKPDSCAGEALYNSAMTAADRTFSSFLESAPISSSSITDSITSQ